MSSSASVSATSALRRLGSRRHVIPAATPSMRLACNAYTQLDVSPATQSRTSLNQNDAMMPPMVITHANGFHKELWEPVLARLDPRWAPPEMFAIDCRNQGDSAILNKNVLEDTFEWITYAKDVLRTVDALGLKKPLGMGHSFGANAIIMAEILRPGTFSAIIAIDPTMFPSQVNLKGPHDGHPLAQLTLKRRDHWKSREEARRKLMEKKLFAFWHPEVLDLYLKHGLVDSTLKDGSSGVTLKTPKFQEAATFAAEDSAAYDAFDRLNEISIPVHIIAGENSEVNPPDLVDLKVARCKHGSVDVLKDAGHLFPMDSPAVTAECISTFLERFAHSQQDLTSAQRRGSKL
ncbi:hypothetical protein BG005_010254 [Podila minutissima]|nr:hypothetical protein BG005_010254 [Podila minutissima]